MAYQALQKYIKQLYIFIKRSGNLRAGIFIQQAKCFTVYPAVQSGSAEQDQSLPLLAYLGIML